MELIGHFDESVRQQTLKAEESTRGNKQLDRRQRKTRQAIYSAFENLMQSAHCSSITVAQIIEEADIGRSTFYAHFETKDELLDQMCAEMFDHIFAGVNAQCTTHANLKTKGLAGLLAHLLYHLRDTHGAICGKLLKEGEPRFTHYFRMQLKDLFERSGTKTPTEMPAKLTEGLLVTGFCECIVWWFDNGAETDPETLAHWFTTTFGCIVE